MTPPTGKTDKQMRVLGFFHAYPPLHNAGAEWMMHAVLRRMAAQGHQVTVLAASIDDGEFEGVKTVRLRRKPSEGDFSQAMDIWQAHDCVFTHLDATADAIRCHDKRKSTPLYWVCHNTHDYPAIRYRTNRYTVVYNSEWVRERMKYEQDSLILNPPVYCADYALTERAGDEGYITLLNCNEAKGGNVLVELARMMPDRKFLGVLGSYGAQVIERLPNLTYIANTPNVKTDVYAKSRIVLMPSGYESWGRVAMEAYAAGLPVLAHPTPGLMESMGPGGLFYDRSVAEAWAAAIKALDDKKTYKAAQEYGLKRAAQMESQAIGQMDALAHMLERIENRRK